MEQTPGSSLSPCPLEGAATPVDSEPIGHIIRLDRSPDGNPDRDLIHVADGRGGIIIMPATGLCPCLEALLNIVGTRVESIPLAIRTVYPTCRDGRFQLCPRYPSLCTRPAYLEHLRRHLESHPDTRDLFLDIPL